MIEEFDNFLSQQECEQLIGLGESIGLKPGSTNTGSIGYRKANVSWFDDRHPLIEYLKKKISEVSKIPVENQEGVHFVKYGISGEYKLHYDGNLRQKTAMIYLNDGFIGGETDFPKLCRTIKPKAGKLVIWKNVNDDGSDNDNSLHAGLPVTMGTKYIAVVWIRK